MLKMKRTLTLNISDSQQKIVLDDSQQYEMAQLIVFKELIQVAPENEIGVQHIMQKITQQCDIFTEVMTLQTLLPYIQEANAQLGDIKPTPRIINVLAKVKPANSAEKRTIEAIMALAK